MLQKLIDYQNKIKKNFKISYKRYLFSKIDFNDKMIAIIGARGVGKTTMLFQYLNDLHLQNKNALYISLDYLLFSSSFHLTSQY